EAGGVCGAKCGPAADRDGDAQAPEATAAAAHGAAALRGVGGVAADGEWEGGPQASAGAVRRRHARAGAFGGLESCTALRARRVPGDLAESRSEPGAQFL